VDQGRFWQALTTTSALPDEAANFAKTRESAGIRAIRGSPLLAIRPGENSRAFAQFAAPLARAGLLPRMETTASA
jgi:hypothetical protein